MRNQWDSVQCSCNAQWMREILRKKHALFGAIKCKRQKNSRKGYHQVYCLRLNEAAAVKGEYV